MAITLNNTRVVVDAVAGKYRARVVQELPNTSFWRDPSKNTYLKDVGVVPGLFHDEATAREAGRLALGEVFERFGNRQ